MSICKFSLGFNGHITQIYLLINAKIVLSTGSSYSKNDWDGILLELKIILALAIISGFIFIPALLFDAHRRIAQFKILNLAIGPSPPGPHSTRCILHAHTYVLRFSFSFFISVWLSNSNMLLSGLDRCILHVAIGVCY